MNSLATGLHLTRQHWVQMQADAESKAPEEACGILAGDGNHSNAVIPITNMLHDPFSFRMDPQEELKAFLWIEENDWEILAIYHSHPHGIDHPSTTDYAELTFPGVVYIILYQTGQRWKCRGYLMNSRTESMEIPITISTS
jgi:[CysO sulfur-carrier protein]-S-L-cysteine hydrolase